MNQNKEVENKKLPKLWTVVDPVHQSPPSLTSAPVPLSTMSKSGQRCSVWGCPNVQRTGSGMSFHR